MSAVSASLLPGRGVAPAGALIRVRVVVNETSASGCPGVAGPPPGVPGVDMVPLILFSIISAPPLISTAHGSSLTPTTYFQKNRAEGSNRGPPTAYCLLPAITGRLGGDQDHCGVRLRGVVVLPARERLRFIGEILRAWQRRIAHPEPFVA